ncbi:Protein N-acetyltransferase, RimJ/RimL family [Actinopolyspora xinjiangensis]|uniref:Protein N-acetyltransferase, RimJ/RimL family n=1 Tax=Actinopolyspora xinjiangensis TaxID=405564 RepID=A0A1H0UPS3_9ACTN|nr:GNAT family N-acetyltransferase [Actinopolyspora xinjiangensis]SDP68151.1 Protein N-acetyltransferase, RimJ/RimL family [Actinopolyspora xinjiangensis]
MANERTTERLRLRPPLLSDEAAVLALHTDPRTNRHRPAGVPTPERVRSDLTDWIRDWSDAGIGYWVVESLTGGEPLGVGGLRRTALEDEPVLNLYYRFRPEAWNMGYAAETATAALEWAEEHRPGLPVVIRTRPSNGAALRVAGKLGFEFAASRVTEGAEEWVYRWSGPRTSR